MTKASCWRFLDFRTFLVLTSKLTPLQLLQGEPGSAGDEGAAGAPGPSVSITPVSIICLG